MPTLADILDDERDAEGVFPPAVGAQAEVLADRYALIDEVGRGGMGIVYRARDHELGEMVALKVLKPELADRTVMVDMLRREVRLARRLTHHNIVRVHDLGTSDGQRFLTMELIVGPSLRQRLDDGRLGLHDVWGIFRQVVEGITAAHGEGILHRDLKPENVLLDEVRERVVLTDFGVANLEFETMHDGNGGLVGTPQYMAPEQQRGAQVDHRADLFSVGAMLLEALESVGAAPGEPLRRVAQSCLAPLPSARPPDAQSLARALDDARPPEPSSLPDLDAPRLVLLPLSSDDDVEWAATSVVQHLTQRLARSTGLRLCAPPASRTGLAAADQADLFVRGHAAAHGEHVVLDIEVSTEPSATVAPTWHERRTVSANGLQLASDQLAESIAEHLGISLPDRPAANAATPLPSTFVLGHEGRRRLDAGWYGDLEPALALLHEGLVQDPNHPGLLADYALASARQSFYEAGAGQMLLGRALRAANAAVRLAPSEARPWYALGYVRLQTGDRAGAAAALSRAVQWAPNLWGAQAMLAELLIDAGAIGAARTRLLAILDIDPTNDRGRMDLARLEALLGNYGVARAYLSVPPSRSGRAFHAWLVERVELWSGSRAPTEIDVASLKKAAPEVAPLVQLVELVKEVREAGQWTAPQRAAILAAPPSMPARVRAVKLQCAAEVAGHLGHVEDALDAVDRGVGDGILHDMAWLDHCEALRAVRAHADFPRLRRRVARSAQEVLEAAMKAGLDARSSAA